MHMDEVLLLLWFTFPEYFWAVGSAAALALSLAWAEKQTFASCNYLQFSDVVVPSCFKTDFCPCLLYNKVKMGENNP